MLANTYLAGGNQMAQIAVDTNQLLKPVDDTFRWHPGNICLQKLRGEN